MTDHTKMLLWKRLKLFNSIIHVFKALLPVQRALFFAQTFAANCRLLFVLLKNSFCSVIISYTSGCGAVGSVLPWGGRGRLFKSGHSDQNRNLQNTKTVFCWLRFIHRGIFPLLTQNFNGKLKNFAVTPLADGGPCHTAALPFIFIVSANHSNRNLQNTKTVFCWLRFFHRGIFPLLTQNLQNIFVFIFHL